VVQQDKDLGKKMEFQQNIQNDTEVSAGEGDYFILLG
jgi:hypothetical protein